MKSQFLTDEQIEHFLQRGHIVLRNCFQAEAAQAWIEHAYERLGYDRQDSSTWAESRVHLSAQQRVPVREFAPDAWAAGCDLLGGAERVAGEWNWSDGFIFNLGIGKDLPWQPPSPQVKGWHKDGDFFRHFLDSPEQGLLTIVLWSDIAPQGGGTFIACDSVGVVARFLADHPEGLLPREILSRELIHQCRDFEEMTGQTGDVVLMHPYLLHTASQNCGGVERVLKERIISNPPIALREPMQFNRPNPDDFSPVERGVLRGLGVERLDFVPQGEREKVVPTRMVKQRERDEAERARLAAQTN